MKKGRFSGLKPIYLPNHYFWLYTCHTSSENCVTMEYRGIEKMMLGVDSKPLGIFFHSGLKPDPDLTLPHICKYLQWEATAHRHKLSLSVWDNCYGWGLTPVEFSITWYSTAGPIAFAALGRLLTSVFSGRAHQKQIYLKFEGLISKSWNKLVK